MEKIDPKHKAMIDKAFEKLSDNSPYERRPTKLVLGSRDKVKSVFIECFTRYDKTIPDGGFKWLSEYDKVLDWMADNEGKGLFMHGSCGRGKSTIILGVVRPMLLAMGIALPGFHASLLPSKSVYHEGWNFESYRKWKLSYIDELGTERMVNDYGEKFEPFNEIINKAEQELDILIISSNLNGEQFLQRYGDRTVDRIKRLCKIVEFKGESLRP